jgi:hypothetical protein
LAISSCATGPAFKKENLRSGLGVVYVYRPSSFIGAALTTQITANRIKIASINTGGYTFFFVEPQDLMIYLEGAGQGDVTRITVEAGKEYYVRIDVGMGKSSLSNIDNQQGLGEIKDTKYQTSAGEVIKAEKK